MRLNTLKTIILTTNKGVLTRTLKDRIAYSPLKLSKQDLISLKNFTTDEKVWRIVFKNIQMDMDMIENKLLEVVPFDVLSKHQKLSLDFIRKHITELSFDKIIRHQNINMELIDFKKRLLELRGEELNVNMKFISQNPNISIYEYENLIRHYSEDSSDEIDWMSVSCRTLSLDFIKDFKDKLIMSALLKHVQDIDVIFYLADEIKDFKERLIEDGIDLNQRLEEDIVDYYYKNKDGEYNNFRFLKHFTLSESYIQRNIKILDLSLLESVLNPPKEI